MRKILAATIALSAAGGAHGAHANLIVNGSFGSGSSGWSSFQTYSPGHADGVETNPSSVYGLSCYNATCMNLEVNRTTLDTVTQTVTGLTPGTTYTLSWAYSGRSGFGPQQMNASFGGVVLASDYSSSSAAWTTETFTVTATSSSELLSFASQNYSGFSSGGNEVTGVSLTEAAAVPEPASLALLGIGALGLGIVRRKAA